LHEIDLALNKGVVAAQSYRKAGVYEQSYCRWRKEYGGMMIEQGRFTIFIHE